MKIWLPDDERAEIAVDTGPEPNERVTVYQQRVTMVLKTLDAPSGFKRPETEDK